MQTLPLIAAMVLVALLVALLGGLVAAVVVRRMSTSGAIGHGGDTLIRQIDDTTRRAVDQALVAATQALTNQTEQRLRSQQQVTAEQSEAARQSIESLVVPLQSTLQQLDGHLRSLETSRAGAYAKLDQQVTDTRALLTTLHAETSHLNAALRRSDTRGRWGELQLERVIELAGMTRHVSFDRQARQTGNGIGRPDVTVHLTDGHVLYIDAKAPMSAFHDAIAASADDRRREHLQRHARALSSHVGDLEKRGYTRDDRSLPFMVLFVPTEASLAAAAETDPRLVESALERGIAVASPTSLAMMLTNISLSWRQQTFAQNAQEILEEVRELHGRLGTFAEHLRRAGTGLQTAVRHYNAAVGSFESRLRPAARSIESKGAVQEPLEPLAEVTDLPREPRLQDPNATGGE